MKYPPRQYQTEAFTAAERALRAGQRTLIVAPTGAGKTVIAAHIVERMRARTLLLAHRKELIEQMSGKLVDFQLDHGIIWQRHPRTNYSKPIQVASIQTYLPRLKSARVPRRFDLVIIDEAHHATADTYGQIIEELRATNPGLRVLGLTATPYRSDGTGLGRVFDTLIQASTIGALVRAGFLVRPRMFVGPVPQGLAGARINRGDYQIDDLSEIYDHPRLVGDLIREWRRHAEGALTVAFCVNVQHASHVAQEFNAHQIPAACVEGAMAPEDRARIFRQFEAGKIRVLTNCMIATEGWDCPAARCALLARPTKSRGLWRQMIGRILRPAQGKPDAILLDHAGLYREHGSPLAEDDLSLASGITRRPRESDPEPTERACPECFQTFLSTEIIRVPGGELCCPRCLAKLPVREIRVDTSAELREVTLDDEPGRKFIGGAEGLAILSARAVPVAQEEMQWA